MRRFDVDDRFDFGIAMLLVKSDGLSRTFADHFASLVNQRGIDADSR